MSEVNATGTVATETKTPAKRAEFVSNAKFIQAWQSSTSAKEVANKVGLEVNSVLTRASKMRNGTVPIPLKNMQKGGGVRTNPDEVLALLAAASGQTIEEVKAASEKLAKAHAVKAAAQATKKAATTSAS